MLAIAGILLLGLSGARFFWTLRRGVYRRFPYDQFALAGGAAVVGFLALLRSPGIVTGALFLVELLALAAVIYFFGVGERYPREKLRVEGGEPFPEVSLVDSEGRRFDSRSLLGTSSVLYYFFRGHF